jgi:hypothetical protein
LLTLSEVHLTPRGRLAEGHGLGRGAGFEITHVAV